MSDQTVESVAGVDEVPEIAERRRFRIPETVHLLAAGESIPVHPAAKAWPIVEREQKTLADDIARVGQTRPGIVYESKSGKRLLIDGQKRKLAADQLNRPFSYYLVTDAELGDCNIVELVYAFNSHSRRLNGSQRAMIAARSRKPFEDDAKKRRTNGKTIGEFSPKGRARDLVGKHFGVDGKQVDAASKVLGRNISSLIEAVDQGAMSLRVAVALLDLPTDAEIAEWSQRALAGARVTVDMIAAVTSDISEGDDAETSNRITGQMEELIDSGAKIGLISIDADHLPEGLRITRLPLDQLVSEQSVFVIWCSSALAIALQVIGRWKLNPIDFVVARGTGNLLAVGVIAAHPQTKATIPLEIKWSGDADVGLDISKAELLRNLSGDLPGTHVNFFGSPIAAPSWIQISPLEAM